MDLVVWLKRLNLIEIEKKYRYNNDESKYIHTDRVKE